VAENQFPMAVEAFRNAVNLERGSETLDALGEGCLLAGDYRAAQECFEEAFSKHRNAHALYGLGRLSERLGDPEKALGYFRDFISRTGQRLGLAELDNDFREAQTRAESLEKQLALDQEGRG
jgi:tetratricopeptide (TPR) repeat protein